jgi:amino acid adenylation domain-containing protein
VRQDVSSRIGSVFVKFRTQDVEQSISARFQEQVHSHPSRVAVKTRTESLTYEALDRRANRIAHMLLDRCGNQPQPVGVLLDQGTSLVAAILGVLISRNFYVPIAPPPPNPGPGDASLAGRVLDDAQAHLIVTDGRNLAFAKEATRTVGIVNIDEVDSGLSAEDPGRPVTPDDLAYLFYTSGSTGRPKGVADTHRNVLHNIMRYTNSLRICSSDRLTLLQSSSSSGSVSSLFGALLNGATVLPFDLRKEGAGRVTQWMREERVTIYHSTPAVFRLLTHDAVPLPDLRLIRLEGDQASSRDVDIYRKHFSDSCVLVNGLGATECGLVRQYFVGKDTSVGDGVLPIGHPVEDMDIVLLDEDGKDVGTDCLGEIAVRSRYLSPGYWRRPDLTARAFTADPRSVGCFMYRTGDLGLMCSDGRLEHRGRRDLRRKVRGQWVDTVEVESALLGLGGIAQAVAQIREDEGGDTRLVAYLVGDGTRVMTVRDIRRGLAVRVPDALIPTAYIFLESLPLTRAGKIDRRALAAVGIGSESQADISSVDPLTDLEGRLAVIWSEVLNVTPVGLDDDFFDLGGDSILATRLINRLRAQLGVDLPLSVVFEHPTIEAFARLVELAPVDERPGG